MAKFKDSRGREWDVSLSIGLFTKVREQTGVKLGEILRTDDGIAQFLLSDVETIGQVLWVVCEEQARAAGVTPEEFAAGFGGDVMQAAVGAVLRSVADFFPLAKVAARIRENVDRALDEAAEGVLRTMEATAAAR